MKNNFKLKIKNRKIDIFTIIGITSILIVLLNLYVNYIYYLDLGEIFWYCNIATIIAGFGMIFKDDLIVSAVLISAIPAQFLWIGDFFLEIFGYGLGRTDFLFSLPISVFLLSTILHAILIPTTFYFVYKKGFNKKSLFVSIFLFAILLFITYSFTSITENRNCVFYPCDLEYNQVNFQEHLDYGTFKYLSYQIIYWSSLILIVYSLNYFYFKRKNKLL